ncbi:poly(U)-specific endoribonuclease [Rhinatrema bivittatum]|uniref:poly(U)-specific endoribonuclease n=1 Tax=Rhinatrema bivittatum TaxID=194408 RepID=UPI00112A586E|nr:poly(U)-specific endoribonuclease [Rhinatrema bivittatum]
MKVYFLAIAFIGITGCIAFETCPSTSCEDSCKNRCGQRFNPASLCQCNDHCERFQDCCKDYHLCRYVSDEPLESAPKPTSGSSEISSDTVLSNEEIKTISEKLYKVDHNKAQEKDIKLNKQHLTSHTGGKDDYAPDPLYSHVNTELFSKPTYKCFIELLDNYDRKTGTGEAMSPEHLDEQDSFLQEIMKTEVMKELYKFFHQKNMYHTQQEFVADLKKMWFGLYSRSKSEQDSSGFEHVFVGEVKKGKVSGFHSWIRFYFLEKQGLVDYYSHNYDGPWRTYPDVLGKQFHWDGYFKEVGSAFIGSSPEFDFAIYTLCFVTRPNKKCKISLGGHPLSIQTYTWTKTTYANGKNYIATAYPTV